MVQLKDHIQGLKGIGAKKAKVLTEELGIETCEDLLYYFPYRYIDRSRFYAIHEVRADLAYVQLKGELVDLEVLGERFQKRLVATFSDGHGYLTLVWFKGVSYIAKSLKKNTPYIVFGKPSLFNGQLNIIHPEMELLSEAEQRGKVGHFQALYNTSEKMKRAHLQSKALQNAMSYILEQVGSRIPETLPSHFIQKYALLPLSEALHEIHLPKNSIRLKKAQERLKFEELFFIQLKILKSQHMRKVFVRGHRFVAETKLLDTFVTKYLPFTLTKAQQRVVREIREDTKHGVQMNRLIQGDVGSGKTMVALLACLLAIDNGFQTAIMTPTSILAEQHYRTLLQLMKPLSVRVKLLTGSTKKSERVLLQEELESGALEILVGTHALLENPVKFQNVGLVVIDEQHRFGVAQRATMWRKNSIPPHVLVMTATPIPRTLAMTLYGDLDVSVIDELPPGRKPVVTKHFYEKKRLPVYASCKKYLKEGRQIYIVYPLIKESEKMDLQNLEDGYRQVCSYFSEYQIGFIHGQMKSEEKDNTMLAFKQKELDILVATTVIEVGVDVPNATVMVIENANRFGLSQLHQLRGRVGRGEDQSYCILMTDVKLGEYARKRMEAMTTTNDGFEISEVDLQLRGPGDLAGTQQSGVAFNLSIANLSKDGQLLQYVRDIATKIIQDDPELKKPENELFQKKLLSVKGEENWSLIS